MLDRGRGDPKNILRVIVDWDEHDVYRSAMKAEILSTKYSKNPFDLCPQWLLNDSDVNTECTITLCQALKCIAYGGQGSSSVTAAKARNSVRQTGASVIKQETL